MQGATGLPGRYIGETIRTMADLLTHAKSTNTPLAALLLDQEKAFDKVSHSFLQQVLATFGFGEGFRRWIDLLYSNAHSALKINSTIGEKFRLNRGVRQGDCLSQLSSSCVWNPFFRQSSRTTTFWATTSQMATPSR